MFSVFFMCVIFFYLYTSQATPGTNPAFVEEEEPPKSNGIHL